MPPSLFLNFHRIHEWAGDVLSRTGGTFLLKDLWFTNMDILVTVDPANVHYIMSAKFQNIPKGPEFKKFFDVLGDGIFNSEEETESRVYRKQPLYHSQRRGMSGYTPPPHTPLILFHWVCCCCIRGRNKGNMPKH